MKEITVIVLAAGKGKRMRSSVPKVLHQLMGKPLIYYVLKELLALKSIKQIIIVVGYKGNLVEKTIKNLFPEQNRLNSRLKIEFVYQTKISGTGSAVKSASKKVGKSKVLVLCGDAPLLTSQTISGFISDSLRKKSSCNILTAKLKEENAPGVIVRNPRGKVRAILEKAGLSALAKSEIKGKCEYQEANSGIYLFNRSDLLKNLSKIKKNPRSGEYFLTDIIEIIYKQSKSIGSYSIKQANQIRGINTQLDLQEASKIMRTRVLNRLIGSGVNIIDPETTYIWPEVKIGKNTTIYPFTFIEDGVIIGSRCRLGPFIHIRGQSQIADGSYLGNFLEINRSKVGKGVKIKHFGYIGDAKVGDSANIGAGVVVANYDGKTKNKTNIDKGAFLGSDTILVAPVKIGKKAVTGAGSVVTKDVKAKTTVAGVPARLLKKRKV